MIYCSGKGLANLKYTEKYWEHTVSDDFYLLIVSVLVAFMRRTEQSNILGRYPKRNEEPNKIDT